MEHESTLKRLMLLINTAYDQCAQKLEPLKIERMAEIINQVMSARYRTFHTMEHIFIASEGRNGVAILASIFHDIVYYQVDKRIHPLIAKYLSEFLVNEKNNECILPDTKSDPWLEKCAQIFGFNTAQVLNTNSGLNEFLSAVAAARILKDSLTEWQIIQIIACIEGTIPFKTQNLNHPLLSLPLTQSKNEINETIKMCIGVANQDISGFFTKEFAEFISGTWNLILENNPIFKNPLYSINDYRKALQNLQNFFLNLNSNNVVHQWEGFPKHNDFVQMQEQVRLNIANALQYLELKLMVISTLEALAIISGGDAPFVLMVGESEPKTGTLPIDQYLPKITNPKNLNINQTVLHAFKEGIRRNNLTNFDFNRSPISAYFYEVHS